MEEAKRLLIASRQALPVFMRGIEQLKGSHHIRPDKLLGAEDRPIHMRLGGEVNHRFRLVFAKEAGNQLAIRDVAVHEDVARIAVQRRQIQQIAGVREAIQIHDALRFVDEPLQNEIGPNESGASRDDDQVFQSSARLRLSQRFNIVIEFVPSQPAQVAKSQRLSPLHDCAWS